MTFDSTIPIALSTMLLLSGCGRIEAPEEQWYRQVPGETLQSVPFSHDLQVLGYRGGRWIGKLPKAVRHADVVRFKLWHDLEDLDARSPSSPDTTRPDLEGGWVVADVDSPRRVDIDLLVSRELRDGVAEIAYRALIQGQQVQGTLALPEGYRQDVRILPSPPHTPLPLDEPILLLTGEMDSWSTRRDGKTMLIARRQKFRWYVQFEAVTGDPLQSPR